MNENDGHRDGGRTSSFSVISGSFGLFHLSPYQYFDRYFFSQVNGIMMKISKSLGL